VKWASVTWLCAVRQLVKDGKISFSTYLSSVVWLMNDWIPVTQGLSLCSTFSQTFILKSFSSNSCETDLRRWKNQWNFKPYFQQFISENFLDCHLENQKFLFSRLVWNLRRQQFHLPGRTRHLQPDRVRLQHGRPDSGRRQQHRDLAVRIRQEQQGRHLHRVERRWYR
jgi:hypothetical protein